MSLLPSWLTGVASKIFSAFTKTDEIELEEAKAFRDGRFSPRYVAKYVLIGFSSLWLVLWFLDECFGLLECPGLDDLVGNFSSVMTLLGF